MMLPVLAAAWIFGQSNAYDPITAFRSAYDRYLRAQTVGEVSGAYTEMTAIASALRDEGGGTIYWQRILAQMDQLLAGVQAQYRSLLQGRDSHGRSTTGLPPSADMGFGVMRYQQAPGRGTIAATSSSAGIGSWDAWRPPDADPRRPGRQRPKGVGPRPPRDARPGVPGIQPPRGQGPGRSRRPPDARPGIPGYQPPRPGGRRPPDARPGIPGYQPPGGVRRGPPRPRDMDPNTPGIQPPPEFCARFPGHPACRATDAAPNIPGWQAPIPGGAPGLPAQLPGIPPFFPAGALPPGLLPTGVLPPGVPTPASAIQQIRNIKDEVVDVFSGWGSR